MAKLQDALSRLTGMFARKQADKQFVSNVSPIGINTSQGINIVPILSSAGKALLQGSQTFGRGMNKMLYSPGGLLGGFETRRLEQERQTDIQMQNLLNRQGRTAEARQYINRLPNLIKEQYGQEAVKKARGEVIGGGVRTAATIAGLGAKPLALAGQAAMGGALGGLMAKLQGQDISEGIGTGIGSAAQYAGLNRFTSPILQPITNSVFARGALGNLAGKFTAGGAANLAEDEFYTRMAEQRPPTMSERAFSFIVGGLGNAIFNKTGTTRALARLDKKGNLTVDFEAFNDTIPQLRKEFGLQDSDINQIKSFLKNVSKQSFGLSIKPMTEAEHISMYGAPEGKVLTKAPSPQSTVGVKPGKVRTQASKAKMTPEERITAPLIGEEKSLIKRVKETAEPGTAAYKAAEQISSTYTPITNKESIAAADKVIKTNVDGAIARVMNQAEPPSAEKSAITVQLMKKFDAEGNDEQLIKIINSYDQQLRAAGQYIQASSLWGNLSPTGMVRLAKKTAEKYGQTLDDDFLAQVSSQMRKVNKMADGKAKETATLNVLNSIAEKLPLTKGELFDSYRYTNMLSNPRTLFERNVYQNLFNVFITRPADILSEAVYDIARHPFNPMARDVSLMDVPRYYKYAVNNYSNAIQMASRALKGEIDNIDLGGGQPVLEQIRRQKNTPLPLSVIPRILEAEDKFNSALIAGGEQARLMRKGLSEADATAQAKKIAEEYLYRNKLGSKENEVLVNRALTSLGEVANSIGNKKVIGKPFRWFVPFINTVVNAAKAQVERSPLGFIGGNYNKQQLAKATLGSLVTGMGAMAAMQGRVTWSAPIDEKERNLFYEQGKKPFSILIGEKWVPAQYLGPFALAFLLPQAVNYYQNETKEALADDQLKKIGKIAGTLASYISQQSSMSGVGGFFRAMEGDTEGAEKTLFFTGEQAIPLSGLLRYIAQAIDPVFRKTKTGLDVIKRDIPFLSKGLEPYTDMSGQPSRRNITDYVAPYSMGINKPEVEPMLLQRRKEIQGKYLLNKMKQEPEKYSGSVTQPTGTASPVVSAYFSDIDTKPEQESWQKIGKSKEYLNKFKSVVDDQSLAPEIKQQLTSYIIQKTGVSQADLNQYYYSSLDVDERTAFVKDRILTLPPQQMIKALIEGRKEISGKALLTSSVIDNLVDEGILSTGDAKFLKNIKSTADGKLKTKSGGRVSSKKLKSIKLPKTKLAKLRTKAAPKVRLEKSVSYKFPKLPKALKA